MTAVCFGRIGDFRCSSGPSPPLLGKSTLPSYLTFHLWDSRSCLPPFSERTDSIRSKTTLSGVFPVTTLYSGVMSIRPRDLTVRTHGPTSHGKIKFPFPLGRSQNSTLSILGQTQNTFNPLKDPPLFCPSPGSRPLFRYSLGVVVELLSSAPGPAPSPAPIPFVPCTLERSSQQLGGVTTTTDPFDKPPPLPVWRGTKHPTSRPRSEMDGLRSSWGFTLSVFTESVTGHRGSSVLTGTNSL